MATPGPQGWLSAAWSHCTRVWGATIFAPGTPEFAMAWYPIVVYWVVCTLYDLLDRVSHPAVARLRITRVEPGRNNPITKTAVIRRMVLVHSLQLLMAMITMPLDPDNCSSKSPNGVAGVVSQVLLGMLLMDTWQFWIHRAMHVNPFLYKHIHSTHHKLLVPYSFGALYNHPLESFLLDSLGAVVSMYVGGLSCQVAGPFFTVATLKTVLDHCGYRFPLNPIHNLFPNNAAYHDIHHDFRFIKKNYSQPWFTWWDVIMGTFVHPDDAHFHLSPSEIKGASAARSLQWDTSSGSRDGSSADLAAAAAAADGPAADVVTSVAPKGASSKAGEKGGEGEQQGSTARRRLRAA